MKMRYFLNIGIIFLIISCATWKTHLKKEGDYEVAVKNAIIDYMNTSQLNKHFNIYHIFIVSNENKLGVSINGDTSKWQIGNVQVGEKRKHFPSRFEIMDGKLFYWNDSTVAVSHEMLDIMNKFDILDTIKYPKNSIIVDNDGLYSEGAVHYYFCKTNYLKYKKKKSKISIGYYEPPKLNCS